MVQPYQNNDYPPPASVRNLYPEDLRTVGERNDEQAWALAEDWLRNYNRWTYHATGPDADPGRGLVLYGPVGTGKTSIAAAWINHIARDLGLSVAFVTDGEWARMFRFRWRESDIDDQLLRLERLSCVVIDDLLRQGTQREPTEIEAIIRQRWNHGLPTIVTLNSGVSLPDPLRSFLREFTWCYFEGKDLRDPATIEKLTA